MCFGTLSDCGSGIYGAKVKGEIVPYCGAHEGIGLFSQSPSVLKRDYPENSHFVFCQNKKNFLFNPLCFCFCFVFCFFDIVGLIFYVHE